MNRGKAGILWLGVLVGSLGGCGGPTPEEQAAAIIADSTLNDAQAVEQLARLEFPHAEAITAEQVEEVGVVLTVFLRPQKEAKVVTAGQFSAAEMDSQVTLGVTLLPLDTMIENGRQRGLARVSVRVRHTVLDSAHKPQVVDVFGYTMNREAFDAFLAIPVTEHVMGGPGSAKKVIERTCTVDYDHFDDFVYGPVPENP